MGNDDPDSSNKSQRHVGNVTVQLEHEQKQLLKGQATPRNWDEELDTSKKVQRKCKDEEIQLEDLSSSRRPILASLNAQTDNIDLHKIAFKGDIEMMRTTINLFLPLLVSKQLNQEDNQGFTPLHYAAERKHVDMCKLLVENGSDVNIRDKKNKTALHLALDKGREAKEEPSFQLLKYLLEKGAHVDVEDEYGQTLLHIASQSGYVECAELLIENSTESVHDSNGFTPLHCAVLFKHFKMCKFLMENGAVGDDQKCTFMVNIRDNGAQTALHLVVHERTFGRTFQEGPGTKLLMQLLELMLNAGAIVDAKDKYEQTPLHLACMAGHTEAVQALIQWKADVTHRSVIGLNALDFAIINGNASCARVIIQDEKWREALRISNTSSKKYHYQDGAYDTPMRRLIRKMPELAEEVFTKCMEVDDLPIDDPKHYVEFDYEFLDDEFTCRDWFVDNKSAKVYDQNGRVIMGTVPYLDDLNLLKKNHPLNIMVEAKQKKLLRHPLVVSLLNHKWRAYGRAVYYLNLCLYVTFLAFFNTYMLTMPPPFFIDSSNVTSSCVAIITDAQPKFGRCYDYNTSGIVAKHFVIVLSTLSLLKELYQVYLHRISYFQSFTNLFEVSLYILTILTVYTDTNSAGPNFYGVREDWQWQIGAVSIFLSWMVLIMFIQNLPTFGIYVLMFNNVLRTFVKFFFVFLLFVLGFGLSFYYLLQNQYAFGEWWTAVIKTSLMMIGEFQFEDIFVAQFSMIDAGADNHTIAATTVNYQAVSYILFVFFIIIMNIIIMNLLVGLAVDDIQGVQENAELESLAIQVKLILDVQYTLPLFIRRRVIRKYRKFYPNKRRIGSAFVRWLYSEEGLNASTINKALNPKKRKHNELEKHVMVLNGKFKSLDGKFEILDGKFGSLDEKFDSLDKKVDTLDGKVGSLDEKFEIMDGNVGSLDGKVESLDGKVESLDKSVEFLGKKVESLDNKIGLLNGIMSEIMSTFGVNEPLRHSTHDESNP